MTNVHIIRLTERIHAIYQGPVDHMLSIWQKFQLTPKDVSTNNITKGPPLSLQVSLTDEEEALRLEEETLKFIFHLSTLS
jgi:hypothetical protein